MNSIFEGLLPNLCYLTAFGIIVYGRREIKLGRSTRGKSVIIAGLLFMLFVTGLQVMFWMTGAPAL